MRPAAKRFKGTTRGVLARVNVRTSGKSRLRVWLRGVMTLDRTPVRPAAQEHEHLSGIPATRDPGRGYYVSAGRV